MIILFIMINLILQNYNQKLNTNFPFLNNFRTNICYTSGISNNGDEFFSL